MAAWRFALGLSRLLRGALIPSSPAKAGDPREEQHRRRQGEQRAEHPRRDHEPGAAKGATCPPFASRADGVHPRAPLGQHRTVTTNRAVAPGAGASRGRAAMDAPCVAVAVVIVEQKLRRHLASLALLRRTLATADREPDGLGQRFGTGPFCRLRLGPATPAESPGCAWSGRRVNRRAELGWTTRAPS